MAGSPSPVEALDLRVRDLLSRWPHASRAFLDYRMACIGCPFSGFDTLREALDVHDVPAEAFFESLENIPAAEGSTPAGPSHAQGEDG